MRVAFWSELYWPYIGGAEHFATRLLAQLRRREIEVLVVTSHHDLDLPGEEVRDGIRIVRFPFREAIARRDPRQFLSTLTASAEVIRCFEPQLVHVNAIGPSALFYLRNRAARGVPMLLTLQQQLDGVAPSVGERGESSESLAAQLIASADWVVGCSDAVLAEARRVAPEIVDRSSRIYNGVETPSLAPAPLPDAQLLCLGRLVPAKGFDVAIRAFASLAARFPDARLVIAGDGAARHHLERLAADSGEAARRIEFRGWIDPDLVPAELNRATMVLMPSRREGLPIAAIQAALMGRPIIGTAVGGLAEVIVDGESGIVVPQDDPAQLAAAIEVLLTGGGRARDLGARARCHILSKFQWTETVSSYHHLYQRLAREIA